MKKIIKQTSKSFIATLAILSGVGLAIAAWSTDTSWTSSNFDEGESITQNMLLARTFGYACNNDSCSQKVYWKKISNSSVTVGYANKACMDAGMRLIAADQMGYYSTKNLTGLDYDGTFEGIQSTVNAGSWHHTGTKYNTNDSCSGSEGNCDYYTTRMPNSRSSKTQNRGYGNEYFLCVYVRWGE